MNGKLKMQKERILLIKLLPTRVKSRNIHLIPGGTREVNQFQSQIDHPCSFLVPQAPDLSLAVRGNFW